MEAFLPTWSEQVQWSDRKKTITRPLFPGYLFVRESGRDIRREMLHVLRGAMNLLPDDFKPMPISDRELENVRLVVASKLESTPCDFHAGESVTIESGALTGVTGVVIKTKGSLRVVVSVEMLRRNISIELDAATLLKAAVK
jgi:transcription antitermination factor NusG